MLSALAMLAMLAPPESSITIDTTKPGIKVSPTLYGIFFEEINHAGDGGLYSELLRNRGFENGKLGETPLGWNAKSGSAVLDDQAPFSDTRQRSLRFSGEVENGGYWGIGTQKGHRYRYSAWLKGSAPVEIAFDGVTATIKPTGNWQRFTHEFRARRTNPKATLTLKSDQPTWLGYSSLLPAKGWKGRDMRVDLAKHVEQMRPSFVRFPGGCFVEGNQMSQGFDWKGSLGPVEKRKGNPVIMWGYPSNDGLGYHEYLQWCEDLGAAPLFVVNCGMSHSDIEPMGSMNRWIQNAMDAIEYANGPTNSTWGKRRAENGHPQPFNLKYIEIGNENGATWSYGGPAPYAERYPLLLAAIKAKYPEIICIADNPVPHPMDVLDEHYYSSPTWFWANKDRYDRYKRTGPKIYVGEYAVTQDCGLGNLKAALGEAAFMTGMERNSDIVTMSSYAPLLVNVNEKQWNPNAIVFNSAQSYGTPSYHVQALFAQNRPDQIVPSTVKVPAEPYRIGGGVGLGTWETQAEFRDIQLRVDGKDVPIDQWKFRSEGWKSEGGVVRQNSLETDRVAVSAAQPLEGAKSFVYTLKAKKLAGREGFIIPFETGSGHALQLNLGGWGNTKHAIQEMDGAAIVSREVRGSIATGEWYDIRIEADGPQVRTYIQGKLLLEYTDSTPVRFAVGTGLRKNGQELIVKLINGSESDRPTNVHITGGEWQTEGKAIVMSSGNLNDENTFAEPTKIAPRSRTLRNLGSDFTLKIPARSVMIVTLRRQP